MLLSEGWIQVVRESGRHKRTWHSGSRHAHVVGQEYMRSHTSIGTSVCTNNIGWSIKIVGTYRRKGGLGSPPLTTIGQRKSQGDFFPIDREKV